MVYDRHYDDRTLSFEASGALWDASLVMRDRETDSWWSIMTSEAIGGEMEGAPLVELPVSEKTTWGDWVSRHPDTRVLSIDGREHVDSNPYDEYFAGDGTFRDLRIDDDRLPPKTPIFAFRIDGEPWAVPHEAVEGGRLARIDASGGPVRLLLHRPPDAPLFASTEAWRVTSDAGSAPEAADLLARLHAGDEPVGVEPFAGIDTFWYNWAAANDGTRLVD